MSFLSTPALGRLLTQPNRICLARGRDPVLPVSCLIEICDQWHRSDLADRWDGSIVSVAVLRRDLVCAISCASAHFASPSAFANSLLTRLSKANLISRVRAICDTYQSGLEDESVIVERFRKSRPPLYLARFLMCLVGSKAKLPSLSTGGTKPGHSRSETGIVSKHPP